MNVENVYVEGYLVKLETEGRELIVKKVRLKDFIS